MDDQLQRRIQLFLQEQHRGRGTKTDGSGLALGTAIGSVRNENQDRAIVVEVRYADAPERNFMLAALCDGLGGMAQGEHAAVLALSTFAARVLRLGRAPSEERLYQATQIADRVVYSELHGNGGTTLTAVLLEGSGKATGINAGDSRLYHIVHDEIRQLSRDDTLGEYLRFEHGDAQAVNHRREILQFVGIGEGSIKPHMLNIEAPSNESVLLLTSDGAHNVPQEVFSHVVTGTKSNLDIVDKLLNLADLMGGSDNATVVALSQTSFETSAHLGGGPDVGMTFRFWSPFDELEILIPTAGDRAQGAPSPAIERDRPPVVESSDTKRSQSGQKRKRPRRKPAKSAPQDTDDAAAPRLDIDFPKSE